MFISLVICSLCLDNARLPSVLKEGKNSPSSNNPLDNGVGSFIRSSTPNPLMPPAPASHIIASYKEMDDTIKAIMNSPGIMPPIPFPV